MLRRLCPRQHSTQDIAAGVQILAAIEGEGIGL